MLQPVEESVFLVWSMPSSRKANASEAVPAGRDPKLHFQSQGNGISKAGVKVGTQQAQWLDCWLPLERLLQWGRRGERRRWEGEKTFAQAKSVEKKCPVRQVADEMCSLWKSEGSGEQSVSVRCFSRENVNP